MLLYTTIRIICLMNGILKSMRNHKFKDYRLQKEYFRGFRHFRLEVADKIKGLRQRPIFLPNTATIMPEQCNSILAEQTQCTQGLIVLWPDERPTKIFCHDGLKVFTNNQFSFVAQNVCDSLIRTEIRRADQRKINLVRIIVVFS